MPKKFLQLDTKERSRIYRALAQKLARPPKILEKDVWVCLALQTLFEMPERLPMAFKGGTSLSKVYNAIARFSEDVDVTLDYRHLMPECNPFAEGISNNQLKRISELLIKKVSNHLLNVIEPHFRKTLRDQFGDECVLTIGASGESLHVTYPTAFPDDTDAYLGNVVLLEFGGRNVTAPNEVHEIVPDIASEVPDLVFPGSSVTVLSPSRTFWEKATLIHAECGRAKFREGADRLSRHWCDLAMLADHQLGREALDDRDLLKDVVRHKMAFFRSGHAHYDACLTGNLRLLPVADSIDALGDDFKQMASAGMFLGPAPDFEKILDRLRALELEINQPAPRNEDQLEFKEPRSKGPK